MSRREAQDKSGTDVGVNVSFAITRVCVLAAIRDSADARPSRMRTLVIPFRVQPKDQGDISNATFFS